MNSYRTSYSYIYLIPMASNYYYDLYCMNQCIKLHISWECEWVRGHQRHTALGSHSERQRATIFICENKTRFRDVSLRVLSIFFRTHCCRCSACFSPDGCVDTVTAFHTIRYTMSRGHENITVTRRQTIFYTRKLLLLMDRSSYAAAAAMTRDERETEKGTNRAICHER